MHVHLLPLIILPLIILLLHFPSSFSASTCYTLSLYDAWDDAGWYGNTLTITNSLTAATVHDNLAQTVATTAKNTAEEFEVCFYCGCYIGQTGGGSWTYGTSWSITPPTEPSNIIAEATASTAASFCVPCTTTCGPGLEPTANDESCVPCAAGHYESSTSTSWCVPCPVGTYSSLTGGDDVASCVACGEGETTLTAGAVDGAECLEATCYTAGLFDTGGDGWTGNQLTITSSTTSAVLSTLAQTTTIAADTAETFNVCLSCGCYTAQTSGGTYTEETSFTLTASDDNVVAASQSNTARLFCVFCTVCPAGEHPNPTDTGCEPCPAGNYKTGTGTTTCSPCPYYTYNPVTGSSAPASCLPCPPATSSLSGAPQCHSSTWTLSTAASLGATFSLAAPGDTIALTSGSYSGEFYVTDVSTAKQASFFIKDPFTITCNGTAAEPCTLDGMGARRVLYVQTKNLTAPLLLNNLNFTDGYNTNGNGGGIYIVSSRVHMSGVTVSHNTAVGNQYGGGLFVSGAVLEITSALIKGNEGKIGGGLYVIMESTLRITSSVVESNTATQSGGGLALMSGSQAVITFSIFRANVATGVNVGTYNYGGGAIYVVTATTTLDVHGTTFADNDAATNTDSSDSSDLFNLDGEIVSHADCPPEHGVLAAASQGLPMGVWGVANPVAYHSYSCLCVAGKFEQNLACADCPRGAYNPSSGATGADECLDCPAGTYSTEFGAAQCTDCPPDTYSRTVAAVAMSVCVDCVSGSFSEAGSHVCTCSAGFYQAGDGCESCEAGKASATMGATASSTCKTCLRGEYAPAGSPACTACPSGTFNADKGSTSSSTCTACSSGFFNANTGSTSINACLACEAGKASSEPAAVSAAACLACPAGTFAVGHATACELCEAGKYGTATNAPSEDTCKPCQGGKSSPVAGADSELLCEYCLMGSYSESGDGSCSLCPSGRYGTNMGMTRCTDCAPGTASTTMGATDSAVCVICSAGSYADKGAATCTLCKAGTFGTTEGATKSDACWACFAGRYSTGGGETSGEACVICEPGMYSSAKGATAASDCKVCTAGKMSDSSRTRCDNCRAGTYSLSGASSCSTCAAGTFNPDSSSVSSSACKACAPSKTSSIDQTFCVACPLGTYYSADEGNCVACENNSFGPDCQSCAQGLHSVGGTCVDKNNVFANMFISDWTSEVLVYKAEGYFMGIGDGRLDWPTEVVFTPTGSSFLVVSQDTDEIVRYAAATGEFMSVFAHVSASSIVLLDHLDPPLVAVATFDEGIFLYPEDGEEMGGREDAVEVVVPVLGSVGTTTSNDGGDDDDDDDDDDGGGGGNRFLEMFSIARVGDDTLLVGVVNTKSKTDGVGVGGEMAVTGLEDDDAAHRTEAGDRQVYSVTYCASGAECGQPPKLLVKWYSDLDFEFDDFVKIASNNARRTFYVIAVFDEGWDGDDGDDDDDSMGAIRRLLECEMDAPATFTGLADRCSVFAYTEDWTPGVMLVDEDKHLVFVTDNTNSRIVAFDFFGNEVAEVGSDARPLSMAFKPGVYPPLATITLGEERSAVDQIEVDVVLRDRFGQSVGADYDPYNELKGFTFVAQGEVEVDKKLKLAHSIAGAVQKQNGGAKATVNIPFAGEWQFWLRSNYHVYDFNSGYAVAVGGFPLSVAVEPGPTHAPTCVVEYPQRIKAGEEFIADVVAFDVHNNPTFNEEDEFTVNGTRLEVRSDTHVLRKVFTQASTLFFSIHDGADDLVGGAQLGVQIVASDVNASVCSHSLETVNVFDPTDGGQLKLQMNVYDSFGNFISDATGLQVEVDEGEGIGSQTHVLYSPLYTHVEKFASNYNRRVLFTFSYNGTVVGEAKVIDVAEPVFESALNQENLLVLIAAAGFGGFMVAVVWMYLKRDAEDLNLMTKAKEMKENWLAIGLNLADPLTDLANWYLVVRFCADIVNKLYLSLVVISLFGAGISIKTSVEQLIYLSKDSEAMHFDVSELEHELVVLKKKHPKVLAEGKEEKRTHFHMTFTGASLRKGVGKKVVPLGGVKEKEEEEEEDGEEVVVEKKLLSKLKTVHMNHVEIFQKTRKKARVVNGVTQVIVEDIPVTICNMIFIINGCKQASEGGGAGEEDGGGVEGSEAWCRAEYESIGECMAADDDVSKAMTFFLFSTVLTVILGTKKLLEYRQLKEQARHLKNLQDLTALMDGECSALWRELKVLRGGEQEERGAEMVEEEAGKGEGGGLVETGMKVAAAAVGVGIMAAG